MARECRGGSELLSYYFNTVNTRIEKIKQVQIDSKWDNKKLKDEL